MCTAQQQGAFSFVNTQEADTCAVHKQKNHPVQKKKKIRWRRQLSPRRLLTASGQLRQATGHLHWPAVARGLSGCGMAWLWLPRSCTYVRHSAVLQIPFKFIP